MRPSLSLLFSLCVWLCQVRPPWEPQPQLLSPWTTTTKEIASTPNLISLTLYLMIFSFLFSLNLFLLLPHLPISSTLSLRKCFWFSLLLILILSPQSKLNNFNFGVFSCKRFNHLGRHSLVLSKASQRTLGISAKNWSESAHRFLKQCVDAGNVEACYILGMVNRL